MLLLPDESIDLVLAFTLFSSLTDLAVRHAVARELARVSRPGGALVIYDLRLPNLTNRHLRPIPRSGLTRLFPGWAQHGSTLTVLPRSAVAWRRTRAVAIGGWLGSALTPDDRAPAPGGRHRGRRTRPRGSPGRPDRLGGDAGPRRSPAPIARSLGAVLDQEGVEPVEIVVVDGHSRDGTPGEIARIAAGRGRSVVVVDNPAGMVPVSMNLGLARCTLG